MFVAGLLAQHAQALFAFLPSGPPTLAFAKAYDENGLKQAGIAKVSNLTGGITAWAERIDTKMPKY